MGHLPKLSILGAGLMLCAFNTSTHAQDAGPVLPQPPALENGDDTILPVPQPVPKAVKPKKKKRGLFHRWRHKKDRDKAAKRPAAPSQPAVEIGGGRGVIFGGPSGVQFGGGVGAKFGGPNGVQFGGGQGARFGGPDGVQFGGGGGAKFGPTDTGGPYGDPVRPADAAQRRSRRRAESSAPPRRSETNRTVTLSIAVGAKESVHCWIGQLQMELKPGQIVEVPVETTADRATVIRFTPRKGAAQVSYSLSPGHYRFQPSRKGWNLYRAPAPKLSAPPRPVPAEPTLAP